MQTTPTLANSLTSMGPPDYSSAVTLVDIEAPLTNYALIWTADTDCYVDAIVTASGASGSIYISVQPPNKPTDMIFMAGDKAAGDRFTYQLRIIKGTKIYTGGDSDSRVSRLILVKRLPVINPPLYVDGQVLVNYSTVEQDTGIKWLDGSPIYQRTFTGTKDLTANANTVLASLSGISRLIHGEGIVSRGASSFITIPSRSVDSSEAATHLIGDITQTTGGAVAITVRSDVAVTAAYYAVTLRYTKV
jgi:hypothetical protein